MKRRYKDRCICNQPAPRPACKAHSSNQMWLQATKRHKRKRKARAKIVLTSKAEIAKVLAKNNDFSFEKAWGRSPFFEWVGKRQQPDQQTCVCGHNTLAHTPFKRPQDEPMSCRVVVRDPDAPTGSRLCGCGQFKTYDQLSKELKNLAQNATGAVRRLYLKPERRGRRSKFEKTLTNLLNDYMRQPSVRKALETQLEDQLIYGVSRVKLPDCSR